MKSVYLIKSVSYRMLDYLIKDIIKDNTNITISSLNELSLEDIINDASYYGLFDEERVIIIKDVKYFCGKFNYEDECDLLKKYLDSKSDNNILIFVCDNILKSKDITKYFISNGVTIIDKSTIEESDIENILNDYIKNTGIKIEKNALDLILKNSSSNLDIVLSEIDKLTNISDVINESIVKTYGSITESDETFEFIDKVVTKNFNEAFSILDRLINNNTEILGLISLLASRYSTMYIVKSADLEKMPDEELANLLGFKNKGRLYYIRKDAKIYTLEQIKEIIINLSILDKKIKTGLNPVYGLKELLLNL